MLEDLNEKLITHHVGGAWRAPYSGRMRALRRGGGGPVIGALAEADERDIARAMHGSVAGAAAMAAMGQAARDRLAAAFLDRTRERAALIAASRALERGGTGHEAEGHRMLRAMEQTLYEPPPDSAGAAGEMALILGTAAGPLEALGAALVQRLRAGGAILLKPAPRAPIVPLALMDALAAAGVPRGAAGLLQGGGVTTGAPLLGHPKITCAVLAGKAAARTELAETARAGGVRLDCRATPPGTCERPGR